jgi:hypothetical protein
VAARARPAGARLVFQKGSALAGLASLRIIMARKNRGRGGNTTNPLHNGDQPGAPARLRECAEFPLSIDSASSRGATTATRT